MSTKASKAQAALLSGGTDVCPSNFALTPIHVVIASPKESTAPLVNLLNRTNRKQHNAHNIGGKSSNCRVDKNCPTGRKEKVSSPTS